MKRRKVKPKVSKALTQMSADDRSWITAFRSRVQGWRKWRVVILGAAAIVCIGALNNVFGFLGYMIALIHPTSQVADKSDVERIMKRLDLASIEPNMTGRYQISAELAAELKTFLGDESTAYKLVDDKLRVGNFAAATKLLERLAQADMSVVPPQHSAAVDKLYLAGLLQSRLNYAESARLLSKALQIDPARDDVRATLAVIMVNQGQGREASDMLKRSTGDPNAASMVINAEGLVSLSTHDTVAAERQFRSVVERARSRRNAEHEAAALGNLGNVYAARGDLKTAEAYYALSVAANRGLQPNLDGNQYCNLGKAKLLQGDMAASENYYQLAIDVFQYSKKKDCLPNSLIGLGLIRFSQSKLVEAEEFLLRALSISEQLGDANTQIVALRNLAVCAGARGFANDKEYLLKALAVSLAQKPDSDAFQKQSDIITSLLLDGGPAKRSQIRDAARRIGGGLEKVAKNSTVYGYLAASGAELFCAMGEPTTFKIISDVVLFQAEKFDDTNLVKGHFINTLRIQRRYKVMCISDTEKIDIDALS
jgi:tetratricopeptide (TPR) repeat protein